MIDVPEVSTKPTEVVVQCGGTVVTCRPVPPEFGVAGGWRLLPPESQRRTGHPMRLHRDQQAAEQAAGMLARELEKIRLQRERLADDEVAFLEAYALDPALGRALSGA